MKKIISYVLIFAFILSSLCTSAIVFADADEFLYKQCFDSDKTNTVPGILNVSGSSSNRVVDDGKSNKAFHIGTSYLDNVVSLILPEVEDDFVLSFMIKRTGKVSPVSITLADAVGTTIVLADGSENGSFRLGDGKTIGGIGKNNYCRISLVLDKRNGFYSVNIGDSGAYKWPLSKNLSGEMTLTFATSAAGEISDLYIDDILLYSGTNVKTVKVRSTYNPASIEYYEEDESNIIQKVYIKQDFQNPETEVEGLSVIQKNNLIEVRNQGENRYIYFEQNNPELDFFINMSIGETSSNVVWEMDVKIDTPGMEVALMMIYDNVTNPTAIQTNILSFNNGVLRSAPGNIGNLTPGKWYNFAGVLNLTTSKYDLYIDGVKKVSGAKIYNTLPFRKLTNLRIWCNQGKSGDMSIDNIKIYDGKEPRDISDEVRQVESIFANDSLAENFLKTKTALNPYTGVVYYGGKKEVIDALPVIDGDDIYITEDVAKKFLPDVSDVVKAKKITDNTNDMYLLSDLINLSKRYVYDDLHGCFISADDAFEANKITLENAHKRASFIRPTAEVIKNDLIKMNGENLDRHPRLYATANDFERLRTEIQTDPRKKEWFEVVKNDADALFDKPVCIYDKYDGLRILEIAADFQQRITNLGFCWKMTGDKKYAERAWKEIEGILAFPDWNAKDHFLDTACLAEGFAIGHDWFYEVLTKEQRQKMYDCGFKYALKEHYNAVHGQLGGSSSYIQQINNWNATCNSGIMDFALSMAEYDPDYCAETISTNIRSLEYMWYYFAPDGAWHEGTNYWAATLSDSVVALANMNTALDTDYNMHRYKGLDKMVFFVPVMAGSSGQLYNFHDTGTEYRSVEGMFWAAKKFNDPSMATLRLQFMEKYKNASTNKPSVFDILWCDTSWTADDEIELEKDWFYRGTEMIINRSSYDDPSGSFLGYHGAETYGGHAHIDAGAFVYDIDGTRWAMDFGSEMQTYYVDYAYRNNYYRVRGEGHNIVIINPSEADGQDRDGFAKITRYEVSENSAISAVDLSSCYKEDTSSYQRGFYFTNGRRVLTVRDEINLKNESEMYWFMHTSTTPEIVNNNTAILTYGDKQLKVEFAVDADSYELTVMDAVPLPTSPNPSDQTPNPGVKKLALKIKDKGQATITAKLSMLDEPYSTLPVITTPISEWKLDDSGVVEAPKSEALAESILIDGKSIEEYTFKAFDPNQKSYTVLLVGQNKIPQVTAVSGDRKVEAANSEFADGIPYTLIKIYQENGYYTPYIIKYNILEESDLNLGEYKRYAVYDSMSSAVPEPQNGVTNSYDGSLETRWSTVSGDYMVHDLGTSKKIDAFGAAFMNGTKRQTMFDILVSEDGENYTLVYSGASSGTTDNLEIFEIKESVNARYVKFLGHGNTDSEWTSVTEFYALERK